MISINKQCYFNMIFYVIFQGLKFTVVPSDFEETLDPKSYSSPDQFVIATAKGKAEEVSPVEKQFHVFWALVDSEHCSL